jgi:hypothetical protein
MTSRVARPSERCPAVLLVANRDVRSMMNGGHCCARAESAIPVLRRELRRLQQREEARDVWRARIFAEECESAKTTDRSQLQNLLTYCRTHKGKVHFVVVYNLTRFAREKYDHFALRARLKSLGISLRSATEPIDETSTGKLIEGVLAAFAQCDNDVRSERTRAGMRAALELGRWTFPAPLGYLKAPKWPASSCLRTSCDRICCVLPLLGLTDPHSFGPRLREPPEEAGLVPFRPISAVRNPDGKRADDIDVLIGG